MLKTLLGLITFRRGYLRCKIWVTKIKKINNLLMKMKCIDIRKCTFFLSRSLLSVLYYVLSMYFLSHQLENEIRHFWFLCHMCLVIVMRLQTGQHPLRYKYSLFNAFDLTSGSTFRENIDPNILKWAWSPPFISWRTYTVIYGVVIASRNPERTNENGGLTDLKWLHYILKYMTWHVLYLDLLSVETVFQDGAGIGKCYLLSKALWSVLYYMYMYVLSMYLQQYHGCFPVLQRSLRNKLQATERCINRVETCAILMWI